MRKGRIVSDSGKKTGPEAGASRGGRTGPGFFDKGFAALEKVGLAGIRESPGALKAVVCIALLAVIAGLVMALAFVARDEPGRAFWTFGLVVGVVVVSLAICLAWSLGAPSKTVPGTPTWTRLVPRLPMGEDTFSDLCRKLEGIRYRAHEVITTTLRKTDVSPAQLRTNVFFPDTTRLGRCGAFELHNVCSPGNDSSPGQKQDLTDFNP